MRASTNFMVLTHRKTGILGFIRRLVLIEQGGREFFSIYLPWERSSGMAVSIFTPPGAASSDFTGILRFPVSNTLFIVFSEKLQKFMRVTRLKASPRHCGAKRL
jgi:hypothetical protein